MEFAHGLRKLGAVARNVFAHEKLETEPETPPSSSRARSLARALFAIEELPLDPEAPAPPAHGPGALRALFAPEPLPEDPPEPPRPSRHRWLAWLFRPESLDPHQE